MQATLLQGDNAIQAKPDPLETVSAANPMAMIQKLIDGGADPEKLDKFLDLAERWQANRAREEYNRAMNACQKELPRVVKEKEGNRGKYAPLEAVMDACKPIIGEHGFSLSWSEQPAPVPDLVCLVCDIRHVGGHVEKAYGHFPRDGAGAKGNGVMNAIQGTGSTMTYAKRYMTLAIFNVTVGGQDTDGNHTDPPITKDQIEELNGLIDDCHQLGATVDTKRLHAFLAVKENIGELRYSGYSKAKHFLWEKKKKAGAK